MCLHFKMFRYSIQANTLCGGYTETVVWFDADGKKVDMERYVNNVGEASPWYVFNA